MAISVYSELVTALAQALRRPGDPIIAGIAANMIVLAEIGMRDGIEPTPIWPMRAEPLRLRSMKVRNPTFAVTNEYSNLPAGFLGFVTAPIIVGSDPIVALKMRSPEHMNSIAAGSEAYASGDDLFAAIIGNQLWLRAAPSNLTLDMAYYTLVALNSTDPASTNEVLTNSPNIYLFGAAREAAQHLGLADPSPQAWHDRYLGAVNAASAADRGTLHSISTPVMVPIGPTP